MSTHCNCVTSTVCVPVCVTGPWRCICRNLTDFNDVVLQLASCSFNTCGGNVHLPNACFIVFMLSAPLLDFSTWMLLIIVSPQSHHRTASFPPRNHPCTRTVCVLFSQSSSRLHSCVWVGRGSLGVRACTPVRGTGAATLRVPPTLCRALFPRASGRRLHVVHLDRAPWPCSAVEFALLARPFSSRLLHVARARLRLVTPAAVSVFH